MIKLFLIYQVKKHILFLFEQMKTKLQHLFKKTIKELEIIVIQLSLSDNCKIYVSVISKRILYGEG